MPDEKVEFDDKEMFNSAIADQPKTEPIKAEEPAKEPAKVESDNRDELGRFKAKDAEPAPTQQEPAQQKESQEDAQVPSWRLRELREQREAAERRAQEIEARYRQTADQYEALQRQLHQLQQSKQEPVDFFTDPQAALQQTLSPLESRFEQMQSRMLLRASRAEALAEHGKAAVAEMEQAIDQAMRANHPDMPPLAAQMRNSDDPVGVAMNWYRRDKLLRETGGDITGYKAKLQDDLLKDPAFLAKAIEAARTQANGSQGTPNTTVKLPPSIGRAPSAGNSHDVVGDLSDASLYQHAIK